MSKPEPVAWWCEECTQISQRNHPPVEHGWPTPLGDHKCDGKFTPIYPPSVVAGELRNLEQWAQEEKDFGIFEDVGLKKFADEAARRAAAWEAK